MSRAKATFFRTSTQPLHSILNIGHGGMGVGAFRISSSMEATFFRRHRNQRDRRFIILFCLAQVTKAVRRYFHRTATVAQMAPHLSKFELALVRRWQPAARTAKELWALHKTDRTRRRIKPVCFSAFKKQLNGTTHRGEPETRGRKCKLGPRAVRARWMRSGTILF